MATYTNHGLPGSPTTPWFDLRYVGDDLFSGPDIVFFNEDGTETHIIGGPWFFSGPYINGFVGAMSRTSAGGGIVYEEVTGLDRDLSDFFTSGQRNYEAIVQRVFAGPESFEGWSGQDLFKGGGGADAMDGKGGFDFADYKFALGNVLADLANPSVNLGEALGDTYTSIEGLIGSKHDDRLRGDADDNQLLGREGTDILTGRGGADLLDGGDGVDYVDYIESNVAVTVNLATGVGSGGEAEGDTYISIENVRGGGGNDTIIGTDADNMFRGAGGADHLDGGAGFDIADYRGSGMGVTVDLLSPANNTGEAAGDSFVSIEGIRGSDLDDRLFGDNKGSGQEGGNILEGGLGGDLLNGRGGFDWATYAGATGPVTASLADPGVNTGEAAGDSYASIEGLIGGIHNDTLIGNSGDNLFATGGGQKNIIDGGDGFDLVTLQFETIPGGYILGLDLAALPPLYRFNTYISIEGFIGSKFNDLLYGDAGVNLLRGEAGNDTLDGGGGADTLVGGLGDDIFITDDAGDIVQERAGGGTDELRTTLSNASLAGIAHVENLTFIGTGGATLTGESHANRIEGASGNDIIDGGANADVMIGHAGDDTYYVDSLFDSVIEQPGEGNDTVHTALSYTLTDNVEKLFLTGTGPAAGTGNALDNEIHGNSGANRIDGLGGADRMIGGGGNDTYIVSNAGDMVVEAVGEGLDTIYATGGSSYAMDANVERLLYTGLQSFTATGNDLDNYIFVQDLSIGLSHKLYGGAGNDTIISSAFGMDLVDGGEGADTMAGYSLTRHTFVVDNIGDVVLTGSFGDATPRHEVIAKIDYTLGTQLFDLTLEGAVDGTGNKRDNVITGSAEANVINGAFGKDTIIGGGGNDALTGGRDSDSFVFKTGFGHDVITDFAVDGVYSPIGPDHDVITWGDGLFTDLADMLKHSADTADGVVVTVNLNNSLLIQDTTTAELAAHPEDFHFA
jgi:Ca2+-binding RTX toxin-like protein